MNPFRLLYQFVADKKIKLSHRAAVVVVSVFILFIIDNVMGFTFNYRVKTQLDILKSVDEIIINPQTDSVTKSYALKIRDKVVSRRNVIDYLFSRQSSLSEKNNKINTITQNETKSDSAIKNNFLFMLSTSGLFVIAALFSIWVNLFWSERGGTLLQQVALAILYSFGFLLMALFLNFLLKNLPIISIKYGGNYFINFVIQFVCLWVIIYLNNHFNEERLKNKIRIQEFNERVAEAKKKVNPE